MILFILIFLTNVHLVMSIQPTLLKNAAVKAFVSLRKNAKKIGTGVGKNVIEDMITDLTEKFTMKLANGTLSKRNFSSYNKSFYTKVEDENHQAFKLFQNLLDSPSHTWKTVFNKDGITVERKSIKAGRFVSKEDAEKGSKHACVRTIGIINCTADKIFYLFQANDLVPKYNEHVRQLKDVHVFNRGSLGYPSKQNQWSKITWSSGMNRTRIGIDRYITSY